MDYHKRFEEHYVQFILNNAEELNNYLFDNSDDYYDDVELTKKLFNYLMKEHLGVSTGKILQGVTASDVVTSEDAVENAIRLYEDTLYSRYVLDLTSILSDKVEIIAKSEEEAIDTFLNDMVEYSKLVEEVGGKSYYRGTDIEGITKVE